MTISQTNNVGGFAVSSCLASGVAVATAPATTTGALMITPAAAGTCAFTITGTGGLSATIGVTVTTTVLNQQ